MTDHVKEAQKILEHTLSYDVTDDNTTALVNIGAAQIQATLALVEQQRIANLIALASLPEPGSHEEVRDLLRGEALHVLARWERISPDGETPVMTTEIKEALGL